MYQIQLCYLPLVLLILQAVSNLMLSLDASLLTTLTFHSGPIGLTVCEWFY